MYADQSIRIRESLYCPGQIRADRLTEQRVRGGAMNVRELSTTDSNLEELLSSELRTMMAIERGFRTLCKRFAQRVGHQTNLRLAWSIVRGKVKKIDGDYLGPNLNKASRLCDLA